MFHELMRNSQKIHDNASAVASLHLFYANLLRRQKHFEEAERQMKLAEDSLSDIRTGTCFANPDDVIKEFINLYNEMGQQGKKSVYEKLLREVKYSLPDE